MGRGYVVGLLVGALFSSVSVGALSLMLPPVAPITPPDMPETPAPAATGETPAAEPADEPPAPEAAAEAPEAAAPAVPEVAAAPDATEAPAGDSAAGSAPAAMPEPPAPAIPAIAPENPPAPAPQDMATEAPQGAPTETSEDEIPAAPGTDALAAATPRPETPVVDVPAGSEFNRPKPEEDPVVPAPQPAPALASAPSVSMPSAETQPELTERTPAAIPEGQAVAPTALAEPAAPAAAPVTEAPAAESSVPVPPPGEAAAPGLAPAPEAEGLAPADAVPAPATEAPGATEPAAQAQAKPEPKILVPLPPQLPGETGAAAPVILPPPDDTAEGQIVPAPGMPPTAEAGAAENAPRILTPGAGRGTGQGPVIIDIAPQPPIGAANGPKVGFSQKSGVKVNRLPSIAAATPAPEAAPDPAGAENAAPDEAPAVSRYAAAFDNPEQKPVIAVILVDDGAAGGAEPDSVAEIGAPVTIGIDPERPGAQVLAQTYRLSGEEVAILAPVMPDGATPSDVEVSYQGFVQALPESVALIAAPDSAVQGDRRAAQHMAALLASEGRALVTYAKGLNPARQAAERAGVPYAGIVRSLDEAGQDDAAMQRLLDRAAFDATRGGSQVVIGHATPVTVAALKNWIAAGGNEAVIGPLSAVLKP